MAARVDSWTTRDSDDRRVSVTVVPDGFYLDVEKCWNDAYTEALLNGTLQYDEYQRLLKENEWKEGHR